MPTKGQCKNHSEQAKLKQEDMEVYKEKMELAIADYVVSKSDPAMKKTMQDVARYWRVPLALLGHHIKGTRGYKIDYIADNGHLSIDKLIQLIQWLGRLAEAGFPAGSDEIYNLASKICAEKYGPEFVLGKNWVG